MELTFQNLIFLPIGLGLIGFIEPCTVGVHLLFLETQVSRSQIKKLSAVLVFIAVRSLTVGVFGALITSAGRPLIQFQTNIWLVFGSIYLALGLLFLFNRDGLLKRQINLAPAAWKRTLSPVTLGFAFGLNIPACAAPILFGLLGLVATTGSVLTGFTMMFLFGLALSAPLAIFAVAPAMTNRLERVGRYLKRKTWIIGAIFTLLGIWSIWFGLYVDPAAWA